MKTKLTDREKFVLETVRKMPGATQAEIAAKLQISVRGAQDKLAKFRAMGLLPEGPRRGKSLPAEQQGPGNDLNRQIMDAVRARPRTLGELSTMFDRSKASIEQAIKDMHRAGIDIGVKADSKKVELELGPRSTGKTLNLTGLLKQHYRFGIVADTQFGSKCQQISLLRCAYDEFDKQDVDAVLHAGDLVDGIGMYKGHEYELFLHSADEQRDYVIKNYPKLKNGKKTHVIGGNHDAAFKKKAGYNIVRAICEQRPDMAYCGDIGATFTFGNVRVEMVHPDGGVAYALSYKPQKHAEAIMGSLLAAARQTKDFSQLPHMLILGHWHVWAYLPAYQGMKVISAPCFQSQTGYLKAKGLMPQVGFMVVDLWLDKDRNLLKATHQDFDLSTKVMQNDF